MTPKEIKQLQESRDVFSRFRGLPKFEWVEELNVRIDKEVEKDNQIAVYFQNNPFLRGMEHFHLCYTAIRFQKTLSIAYQSYRNPEISLQYIVSPFLLKQYNNRWFLFCWETETERLLDLALDRIENIEEVNIPYFHKAFDHDEYFEDIIGVTLLKEIKLEVIQIAIRNDLWPYIESKPLHGSQKVIKRTAEEIIIELQIIPNYEFYALILSHKDRIKLLSPQHVVDELKTTVKNILNNYSN